MGTQAFAESETTTTEKTEKVNDQKEDRKDKKEGRKDKREKLLIDSPKNREYEEFFC